MSLLKAYDIKKKKSKQKKLKLEEADDLLAEIEKVAVSEETAKMWMEDPCLPPDSIIETEDGPQRIADIQVGAKVLTHKGFHKVSKTYSREFSGELIALTPYYSNMPLILTPSHPVLAIKTIKKCYYNKHRFGICLPTCSVKNKLCNEPYKQYKIEWIPAGQLEKGDAVALGIVSEEKEITINLSDFAPKAYLEFGDYLVYAGFHKMDKDKLKRLKELYLSGVSKVEIKKELGIKSDWSFYHWLARLGLKTKKLPDYKIKIPKQIKIDGAFARLAGYYVAEGCIRGGKKQIDFSFNSNEKSLINDVIRLMRSIFNLENASVKHIGNCVRVRFTCKPVASMFHALFGARAELKQLPSWFIELPKEVLWQFIFGYFLGDGYTASSGRHGLEAKTASLTLARQIRTIFHKLGIPSGIRHIKREGEKRQYNGRTIVARDIYAIVVPSKFAAKILNNLGKPPTSPCRRREYAFKLGGHLFVCLKKVERVPYSGLVYNLEVNPAETYVAEGIIVHNCGRPC